MNRLLLTSLLAALAIDAAPASAGEMRRLTKDGRLKFSPVYIHETDAIAFTELETPKLYRLKRLNLADGTIESLHPEASTSEFEPAFARQADVYAYAHTKNALSVSVRIRREGAAMVEIPPADGFAGLRSPAVSSDGKRILFCHAEDGKQKIFAVQSDGRGRTALTDARGIDNWPDFSPDGELIVFGSSRDGDFEIFIMNADGTNVRRLTTSPGQDIRPRFSPDGRQIAFVSHRDGNAEIYLMNADGSNVRRITQSDERDDYPSWHPQGNELVAVCERGGEHDLYAIDVP